MAVQSYKTQHHFSPSPYVKVFFVTTFELNKPAMEDSNRRATTNKRLHVNQRVSGSVREYIEGPTKRRHCQRLYGHIISAIGEQKYMVRFDDGSKKECSSAFLRVEKMHTSVPQDIQMPTETTLEHRVVLHGLEEEVVDQEEETTRCISR
jgi:hypothetical protein